jgi:hypothetical protein
MQTRPWTMLLMMLSGWINRHQQDVIVIYLCFNLIFLYPHAYPLQAALRESTIIDMDLMTV